VRALPLGCLAHATDGPATWKRSDIAVLDHAPSPPLRTGAYVSDGTFLVLTVGANVLTMTVSDNLSQDVTASEMHMSNDFRFNTIPTAIGWIARAAFARASERLDVAPLLKRAGLTLQQIKSPDARIGARNQILFLDLVAHALSDEFLGFRLAQSFELRKLGLLYYVQASSETLGDALQRVARYGTIHNEGVNLTYRRTKYISMTCKYVGVARAVDRHQIEFFIAALVRLCRQLTGRHLGPSWIKLMHRRTEVPLEFRTFFGCDIIFGSDIDEVAYPADSARLSVVGADPYLNSLLVKYCDEALASRQVRSSAWRLSVENAIAPLLPHGQARISEISQQLGVSTRTLERRLAAEGMTFSRVLDELRFDLAKRYLREQDLPISEVAWLLGYRETSAFNHAFKRWTGKTPKQAHSESAIVQFPLASSG
jgi:AraC-like DNA-binding protein